MTGYVVNSHVRILWDHGECFPAVTGAPAWGWPKSVAEYFWWLNYYNLHIHRNQPFMRLVTYIMYTSLCTYFLLMYTDRINFWSFFRTLWHSGTLENSVYMEVSSWENPLFPWGMFKCLRVNHPKFGILPLPRNFDTGYTITKWYFFATGVNPKCTNYARYHMDVLICPRRLTWTEAWRFSKEIVPSH